MKKLFAIFFLFLIAGAVNAETESDTSQQYVLSTDKEIVFNSIPWNITPNEFHDALKALGIEFVSTYTEYGNPRSFYNVSSTSFGDGKIVPTLKSDIATTRKYYVDNENSLYYLCQVAGHNVSSMYVSYVEQTSLELYEIYINISNHKLITPSEQYSDLSAKLTVLYGEPYDYTDETESSVTSCSVWLGGNGSAVYLKHYCFKENNLESVVLCYGLYTSSDTFAEIESRYNTETEQKKNDTLDGIVDDYTGL